MTIHQIRQIEIIDQIERQIKSDSLQATVVVPVKNFDEDNRICLTSVHFPHKSFTTQIYESITEPLQALFPEAYYYPPPSLHLTIKNIRVIQDPPAFTEHDVVTVQKVFDHVVPTHKKFKIYPYRLLLFKNNLALMSTTDEELDSIILQLTSALKEVGIVDDKQYINSRYFFSNMTLARFSTQPPKEFIEKVNEISNRLNSKPYTVDSVSLITSNAVMKKRQDKSIWALTS